MPSEISDPEWVVRPVVAGDWAAIAQLAADEAQEGDHSGGLDDAWLENRRAVDCERYDAVVEAPEGVVGYCAVERHGDRPRGEYRVFAVADWRRPSRALADVLLAWCDERLAALGATRAWMREVAGDVQLLGAAEAHGFTRSTPYTVQGVEIVNLEKATFEPPS